MAEVMSTSLADMSGSYIDKSGCANNMAGSTSSDCSAVRENGYRFGNTTGATGNHGYDLSWNDFWNSHMQFVFSSMYLRIHISIKLPTNAQYIWTGNRWYLSGIQGTHEEGDGVNSIIH